MTEQGGSSSQSAADPLTSGGFETDPMTGLPVESGAAGASSSPSTEPAAYGPPASTVSRAARHEPSEEGRSSESAFRQVRRLLASAVMTVAVLAAVALALGAGLLALGANQDNAVVSGVLDLAGRLDGPFADLFVFDGDLVKQALVNWGIAAVIYLAVGRLVERIIRP